LASFRFDVDITLNGHMLNAMGSVTPARPAVMYLRNGDPGYPAEGGEIEDLELLAYYRKPARGGPPGPWRTRKLCQGILDSQDHDEIAELIWEKLDAED
jgi:hypothetical protein